MIRAVNRTPTGGILPAIRSASVREGEAPAEPGFIDEGGSAGASPSQE